MYPRYPYIQLKDTFLDVYFAGIPYNKSFVKNDPNDRLSIINVLTNYIWIKYTLLKTM